MPQSAQVLPGPLPFDPPLPLVCADALLTGGIVPSSLMPPLPPQPERAAAKAVMQKTAVTRRRGRCEIDWERI